MEEEENVRPIVIDLTSSPIIDYSKKEDENVFDLTISPIKKELDLHVASDGSIKEDYKDLKNSDSDCSLLETPNWLQDAKKQNVKEELPYSDESSDDCTNECPKCAKAFSTRSNLLKHTRLGRCKGNHTEVQRLSKNRRPLTEVNVLARQDEVKEVECLPFDVDGDCAFKITCLKEQMMKVSKDGRPWKQWVTSNRAGFDGVRRIASCDGTYRCINTKCPYLLSYKKENKKNFQQKSKADVVCGCCGYSAIAVPCMAKKVWEFENSNVIVYHSGTHTCEAKPPLPDATLKAEQFFKNNSASKPSQFPYECLRSSLHDGKTIEEVYSEAKGLTNLKKIQNIKQKVVKEINPVGHSFDALAKIKEATDKYDPYLLWKVKDGRLDGSTIVFRTSKEKLEIAVQMQLGSQHSLEEEDCFLDAEHDRVKGMKTINLSVLHPTIKEIVTIASMECETESTETLCDFWKCLNEALSDYTGIPNYIFDPHGFVTDEHGGNRESIRRQLKPDAVNRASSCEMHFYSCARRQESADWSNKAKTEFRKLVHAIYSAATPGSYQAARRALHTWTEKKAKRGHAKKWFEGFWHPRRFHAFRVFKSSTTANTNMAEVGHARNAVRGARNDTLSRAAEDHVVECALLKGKLEQYEQGNYAGGKCPSQKQKNEMSLRKQVDRAGVFAKELALGIDLDSYHAEVFVDKNSSHRAKATTAQVSMTADPLEMQSSDEDELQPSKKMKPKYRKRTTRSKQFEQSLKLAKRARLTLDDVHDVSETQKVFELNDNGNIRLVEIGETPACNCTFGQGKNVCFHMIWVMMNVLKVNERDEILFQKMLTSSMVKTLFKNLAKDVSQERSGPESSMNSVSGTSSTSVMVSGQSFLHDLQSRDRENFPRATAAAHSSMSSASGNCSSTDIHVSSGSFLQELQSVGRDNSTGPSTPSGLMDSVSENSSSTVMSFLHELEPVSSVSYATPSASNSSVTSNSGNSSNTVMSSNSFLHELQSFGGDINARPPATHSSVNSASGNCSTTFGGAYARPSPVHSSVNSASGNCSTTFGGAYARPPAAYSPVFTRPPWHNSNPFVVVNLTNRIKKCAGCPFPFRDAQGPVYLGVAVKHVEKDVYFDKASSTQRVTNEGNRYYHCQVSCITSRHPYFSPAMLRADPDLLLDDFQRYSLNSVFGVSF